jgi:hypothetical protein
MWEWLQLWVVIGCTVEDEISRLEVTLSQVFVGQEVKLIRLVPFSESVAKLLAKIEDALPDKCATV